MSDTITPEKGDQHGSFSCGSYLVRIALAVLLLAVSIGLCVGGSNAIEQQRYEMKWRAMRAVGFSAWESHGVSQYQGAAAVCMGVGFMSVGGMLIVWVVALLWSPDWRRTVSAIHQLIVRVLGWSSLCALLLACGCFFPPWQVESLSFYGVVVLLTGFVTVRHRLARERWQGRVGIALIVGTVVAGFFSMDTFVGMALGIFVFLIGGAHLALLVSPIRRALEEQPAPSNG